jgi:hypothetical protein
LTSCFEASRRDMNRDERSEAATLGLGSDGKIADVSRERVRLFWPRSLGADRVCRLGDHEMEACNG